MPKESSSVSKGIGMSSSTMISIGVGVVCVGLTLYEHRRISNLSQTIDELRDEIVRLKAENEQIRGVLTNVIRNSEILQSHVSAPTSRQPPRPQPQRRPQPPVQSSVQPPHRQWNVDEESVEYSVSEYTQPSHSGQEQFRQPDIQNEITDEDLENALDGEINKYHSRERSDECKDGVCPMPSVKKSQQ